MALRRTSPNQAPSDQVVRGRIVAEARRQYLAQGFRGVTMDDLAGRLGMSKKTLYAQFASKSELLDAVIQMKLDAVEADMKRIASAPASDVAAALREFLACLQQHVDEIRPPFLRDLQRQSPETFHVVEERRRKLLQRYFGALLQRGRKAGIVRKDVSAEVALEILLGAVQGVLTPPKLAQLELTPKEGLSAVLSVVLEGLITAKGRSKR